MATTGAEDDNQRLTIGVVVTCLVLSALSFGLRIYARVATSAKLWWDDYWMIWVMLICIAASTSDFVGLAKGSGIHQEVLPVDEVISFMKNLYVYMLIWAVGVFSVKVGILLFYWRVFHTRAFRIGALTVGGFSVGIFLSNFFSFALQCSPVAKFFDHTVAGQCIDQHTFYLASAIINVLGDVAVLLLPLPVVWRLHTSRSKKWSLSFLFLLGAFVCVASIFRIIAVEQIDPEDFTFTNVGGGLWSTVEIEVGFICANLPAVRPLIFKWFGWGNTVTYGSGSNGPPPRYDLPGAKGMRSGHRKLQSRNQESDLRDSDEEALTTEEGNQNIGLSDIVVKTDIGVSIGAKREESQAERRPDHFVNIISPNTARAYLPRDSPEPC
ncbi:hypothetical protein F4778DRAFT_787663 [Xylariomycetidae sp. FL2044]|nr:hypothetical protein F4778DRAFT_787663 [Xylariomycetidae sp. FL2044]